MAVSAKKRAESAEKAKKRWKKRQQHRPVAKTMVTLLQWLEDAPEGVNRVAKTVYPIEITFEPMKDQIFDALSPEWQKRLLDCSVPHPQKHYEQITIMQDACEQIPHVPQVWNYLGNLYLFMGNDAAGFEAHRQSVQRFPNYFVGRMAYALSYLENGNVSGALEVLGGDVDLYRLLNDRKLMHFTEVANYLIVCSLLCIEQDQLEQAALHLKTLEDLTPDHPMYSPIQRMLYAAGWDGWEEDDQLGIELLR